MSGDQQFGIGVEENQGDGGTVVVILDVGEVIVGSQLVDEPVDRRLRLGQMLGPPQQFEGGIPAVFLHRLDDQRHDGGVWVEGV
jgi:hypothetical protein